MSDPTGRSRATKLAEELNALWNKPTTRESLRLSPDAEAPQTANPAAPEGESSEPAPQGSAAHRRRGA
jgi:hypothetical protein